MIGSIIQGAASVGSGIAGIIGARKDKKNAEAAAERSWQRNYEAQKEFAQNSIQWRVQDAKNAGINPYAVVSGQSAGYTPQDTSYQTNYQHAASQMMNGFADAMGQLNLASAAEDLKGKKLDNNAKALELVNKTIANELGQISATLKQPSLTHTDPIKEVDGKKLITDADGSQWFKSTSDDMDPWNVQAVRDVLTALYAPEQYKALQKANKGKGEQALYALGRAYHPKKGTAPAPNVEAAKLADRAGTLAGWLSLPSQWLKQGIYSLERAMRRRR